MMDINLAPWREHRKIKERRVAWVEMASALSFAILLFSLLHWVLSGQIKETQARLSLLQERLQTINKRAEEAKAFYQRIEYQKMPAMDLNFILNHQKNILSCLQKLASSLPSTAVLHQVRFEKNSWKIEGTSMRVNAVWQYAAHLKSFFKKINVLALQQKEGQFYFQIGVEMLS